jgi:uncharacterized membrane protein YqjE
MDQQGGRSSGLLSSLRQLTSTLIEIVYTRLELFATELDEERVRIARALWLATAGIFCLSLGILLTVLFLVVLFWDTHRLAVLGGLAAGFLLAGMAAMLVFRARLSQRKGMFSQSLEELKRDHERLNP